MPPRKRRGKKGGAKAKGSGRSVRVEGNAGVPGNLGAALPTASAASADEPKIAIDHAALVDVRREAESIDGVEALSTELAAVGGDDGDAFAMPEYLRAARESILAVRLLQAQLPDMYDPAAAVAQITDESIQVLLDRAERANNLIVATLAKGTPEVSVDMQGAYISEQLKILIWRAESHHRACLGITVTNEIDDGVRATFNCAKRAFGLLAAEYAKDRSVLTLISPLELAKLFHVGCDSATYWGEVEPLADWKPLVMAVEFPKDAVNAQWDIYHTLGETFATRQHIEKAKDCFATASKLVRDVPELREKYFFAQARWVSQSWRKINIDHIDNIRHSGIHTIGARSNRRKCMSPWLSERLTELDRFEADLREILSHVDVVWLILGGSDTYQADVYLPMLRSLTDALEYLTRFYTAVAALNDLPINQRHVYALKADSLLELLVCIFQGLEENRVSELPASVRCEKPHSRAKDSNPASPLPTIKVMRQRFTHIVARAHLTETIGAIQASVQAAAKEEVRIAAEKEQQQQQQQVIADRLFAEEMVEHEAERRAAQKVLLAKQAKHIQRLRQLSVIEDDSASAAAADDDCADATAEVPVTRSREEEMLSLARGTLTSACELGGERLHSQLAQAQDYFRAVMNMTRYQPQQRVLYILASCGLVDCYIFAADNYFATEQFENLFRVLSEVQSALKGVQKRAIELEPTPAESIAIDAEFAVERADVQLAIEFSLKGAVDMAQQADKRVQAKMASLEQSRLAAMERSRKQGGNWRANKPKAQQSRHARERGRLSTLSGPHAKLAKCAEQLKQFLTEIRPEASTGIDSSVTMFAPQHAGAGAVVPDSAPRPDGGVG